MQSKVIWVDTLILDNGTGPVRNPELTDEEFTEIKQSAIKENKTILRQTAYNYVDKGVNGTMPGLIAVGLLKGLPRSIAIQQWIFKVWDLYYERKKQVTEIYNPDLYDFSICGPLPYSAEELKEEVNSMLGLI